jgi:hypothetical protein
MVTEDFSPVLVGKVPAASVEDAAARISNLTTTSLEGLMGSVYSDAEQFRLGMNEAGYTTAYRLKKESASETSRIFVATTTCKDGSQWETTLWEFGHVGSRLLTVIMAKEFVRKKQDIEL